MVLLHRAFKRSAFCTRDLMSSLCADAVCSILSNVKTTEEEMHVYVPVFDNTE